MSLKYFYYSQFVIAEVRIQWPHKGLTNFYDTFLISKFLETSTNGNYNKFNFNCYFIFLNYF